MFKLISKVELLRDGKNGFILTGVDVIKNTEQSRISDNVERTRTLPVPFKQRDLFQGLKYCILVYTRHWLPVWNVFMNDEKTRIDQEKITVIQKEDWIIPKLTNLWKDTNITSIEETPKGFKLTGTIIMGGKSNKVTAIIDADSDFNIYDQTEDLFNQICEEFVNLMTHNILPATTEEIKEIAKEIGDDISSMSDVEMLDKMIELAGKRNLSVGFTVESFNNILEELPVDDDNAVIVSMKTNDPESFNPPIPED